MMLDTPTLRVAFAAVALTLLLLFYVNSYRRTRTAYSRWWCTALILFLTGASAYLLDGTVHQMWANPSGNVLLVTGCASVWAGARSLRTKAPPPWCLALAPAVTGVASVLDSPATNDWAGGAVFLALMSALIGLSSRELFLLGQSYAQIQRPLTVGTGILAVYYLGRWAAFVAEGRDGPVFSSIFGSAATTLITAVLLVVASFTMTELSHEQQTRDLRSRATVDGLTGLLNRTAFMHLAQDELRRLDRSRTTASLILADLDHFKKINDEFGHSAGDSALQAFADACTASVRSTDLVGRYGGEEFILFLPGVGAERAGEITADISRRLRSSQSAAGARVPTVSFGIASTVPGRVDLKGLAESADGALYRAKTLGRNRSVLAPNVPGEQTA